MSDTDHAEFEEPSSREAVLATVPKVAGGLSFCSSTWIVYNVLSDRRRREKSYHRLLALMGLCDMVSSFAYFLSTWPIPQGVNLGWKKNSHLWAAGNDATCTAQAVGIQWGVTSAVLNVFLATHYLLVIRYRATESTLKKYEPYVGTFAFMVGLGLTVPGIVLGIFGNTNLWCWIAPNFAHCEDEGLTAEECIDRTYNYRWGFYYGPLWTCILLITILQAALFVTVCQTEKKASRWRMPNKRGRAYKMTSQVASQACWYVGVFYITWLPYTSIAMTGKFFNPDTGFGVLLMVVLCQPLQGFLHLFVYQRRRLTELWKASRLPTLFRSPSSDPESEEKTEGKVEIPDRTTFSGSVQDPNADGRHGTDEDEEENDEESDPSDSTTIPVAHESNRDSEDARRDVSDESRVGEIYED
jgi:hypothetical protein